MPTANPARTVRIASAIWAGSIFLSRIMALLREQVIGRTLGASRQTDLYFASFTLPDFLNYLLAAGALSIVFIPMRADRVLPRTLPWTALDREHWGKPAARRLEVRSLALIEARSRQKDPPVIGIKPDIQFACVRCVIDLDHALARSDQSLGNVAAL